MANEVRTCMLKRFQKGRRRAQAWIGSIIAAAVTILVLEVAQRISFLWSAILAVLVILAGIATLVFLSRSRGE